MTRKELCRYRTKLTALYERLISGRQKKIPFEALKQLVVESRAVLTKLDNQRYARCRVCKNSIPSR